MQGKILTYDKIAQTGLIIGEDGNRYNFSRADWQTPTEPVMNSQVDFNASGNQALEVYKLGGNDVFGSGGDKNKIVAALLAFFLGGFGIHKFYLGYNKQGIILLIASLTGWILLGIPYIIIGIICLVETIVYATKSDEDFQSTYVDNYRPWF